MRLSLQQNLSPGPLSAASCKGDAGFSRHDAGLGVGQNRYFMVCALHMHLDAITLVRRVYNENGHNLLHSGVRI